MHDNSNQDGVYDNYEDPLLHFLKRTFMAVVVMW